MFQSSMLMFFLFQTVKFCSIYVSALLPVCFKYCEILKTFARDKKFQAVCSFFVKLLFQIFQKSSPPLNGFKLIEGLIRQEQKKIKFLKVTFYVGRPLHGEQNNSLISSVFQTVFLCVFLYEFNLPLMFFLQVIKEPVTAVYSCELGPKPAFI